MEATLIKEDGSVEVKRKDNLITTVGFDFLADAIGEPASRPDVMSHIAVGTGTTAAAIGDTTLETELDRQAATYAHTTSTKIFTFSTTYAAGDATGAITEAGVLNDATTGTLLDRVVFSAINKGAADTLTVTFTFTLS